MIITDITGGHLEDDNIIYSEEKQALAIFNIQVFVKTKSNTPLSHQRYMLFFYALYRLNIFYIYLYSI